MASVAVPPPPPPPPPPPLPSLLAPSGSSSQLLNVAAPNQNGPAAAASGLTVPGGGNAAKPWEKPWSPRELRENAAKWSLAGDSGLLLYLRDFSQRMLQRTHEMEKQVDDLVSDVKTSSVKAHNVFNEFAVLANTQFVENRVYEEDINVESQPPKQEERKEKTREEVEAELVPKVMQAVRLGIEVLEKSFVKLDPHVTGDSEDEDEPYQGDALYEPKDPYVNRPLPYLIGSTQFDESDDVGLRERPPEEAASDHGSLSESEEEELSEPAAAVAVTTGLARKLSSSEASTSVSESDSDSDEEDRPKTAKQTMPKMALPKQKDSESEESGNLFEPDQSDQSDEETKEPDASKEVSNKQRAAAPPLSFASELQKKLGLPPSTRHKSSSSDGESASDHDTVPPAGKAGVASSQKGADASEGKRVLPKASTEQKKSRSIPKGDSEENIFAPPIDDEEDDWLTGKPSPFSVPRKSSLFSPDSGLFGTPAETPATKSTAVPKATPPVQPAPSSKAPAAAAAATGAVQKVSKSRPDADELFRSDSGSDDDLFPPSAAASAKSKIAAEAGGSARIAVKPDASAKSAGEAAASKPSSGKAKGGLFDDDDDDDLFATINSTIFKKASAVSDVVAEQDNLVADTPKLVADEKPTEQKSAKKFPAGAVPIFGNQPNPFAALHANRPPSQNDEFTVATEEGKLDAGKSTGLLPVLPTQDGENDSSSLLPARQNAAKVPLFKSSESVSQPVAARTVKPPAGAAGLFDSGDGDDDDDLFAALSSPKKKETTKKASTLVLDPDEDDSAKDVVKAAPMPSVRPERSGSTKPAVLSLFGEGGEGEEADDTDFLFSAAGSKSGSGNSKAVATSNVNVAQLGSSDNRKQTVLSDDLFGVASAQPPSQATTAKVAQISSKDSTSAAAQQRTGKTEPSRQPVDLFGSDEEDDLFAPKPSRSTTSNSSFGQTAAKPAVPKPPVSAPAKVVASDNDPLFGSSGAVATGASESASKSPIKPVVSKPSVPLTTDSDDDDDGLFSSPKVADKSTASSQKVGDVLATTVKKPAGAVPVLRGIDVAAITKSKPIVADTVDPLAAVSQQPPSSAESRDDTSPSTGASARSSAEESLGAPPAAAAVVLPSGSRDEAEQRVQVSTGSDGDGHLSSAAAAKPKKLPGAVSMFGGGLDPAALILKKADRSNSNDSLGTRLPSADTDTKSNDRRPEPEAGGTKEVQDTAAPRPSFIASTALASTQGSVAKRSTFSEDDDDDSIFSSARPTERSQRPVDGSRAVTAKVLTSGSKAAAAGGLASSTSGGGLFGSPDDEDDSAGLFGIVPKQPDTGTTAVAKSRSDSASASKAPTEQLLTSAKQVETAPSSKAAASSDQPKIRGMFDDDDEDDLFSSKRSSTEPPAAAVPKTSIGQLPKKPPPAEVSIFGDQSPPSQLGSQAATQKSAPVTDEVEDDLFGASKKVKPPSAGLRLPVPDMSSAPAKKPPPGGVPMFGGAALPQLFGKRAAAAAADADTDAAPPATATATSTEKESAPHHDSTVAVAAIDKHKATDVDLFSHAASAGTLTSANKGRARVQQKRRPQSREARLLAAAQSSSDTIIDSSGSAVAEEESASSPSPPTLSSSDLPTQAVAASGRQAAGKGLLPTGVSPSALASSSIFKKAKSGWDPDATDDGDDLFARPEVAKVVSLASPAAVDAEKETSRSTAASASSSAGRAKFRDLFGNDDLLGSAVAGDDHSAFEPSRSGARTAENAAPVAFGTTAAATAAAAVVIAVSSQSSGSTDAQPLGSSDGGAKADERSGDLFSPADGMTITSSGSAASRAAAVHDDLFGSGTAVPATKAAPLVGMDDDDDIFADASILKNAIPKTSVQSAPAAPAAAAEPAASLDISQDATSTAAGKKSSKKAAKPVTKLEDMFADDTDIFADLPTLPKAASNKNKKQAQASSKKKQQEPAAAAASAAAGNIFGDQEDDIFAPSSKAKASKSRDKPKEKTTAATVTNAKKTTADFVDPLAADGGQ